MKVSIVGAGICGLYLSWRLKEMRHEVFVFEKRGVVGKEVCSGLFSERLFNFIPESKKLIKNKIDYCLIHFPKKTIKIEFKKKFFVLEHSELDKIVAKISEKSGVKIVLNQTINTIPENFDRVIGCDGANSIIRKKLGLKNPFFYLGIQGFLPIEDSSNFVETWPTKNGFLWKIPRGNEIEYGIIEEPSQAGVIFDKFLEKRSLYLDRKKSALIPQGIVFPKNKKITLCGDALGLTKPWSGGGVIWGLTAAEILLESFPNFLKYQKELKRFFLPKIVFSKLAKKIVYFAGFKLSAFFPRKLKIDGDFIF